MGSPFRRLWPSWAIQAQPLTLSLTLSQTLAQTLALLLALGVPYNAKKCQHVTLPETVCLLEFPQWSPHPLPTRTTDVVSASCDR